MKMNNPEERIILFSLFRMYFPSELFLFSYGGTKKRGKCVGYISAI